MDKYFEIVSDIFIMAFVFFSPILFFFLVYIVNYMKRLHPGAVEEYGLSPLFFGRKALKADGNWFAFLIEKEYLKLNDSYLTILCRIAHVSLRVYLYCVWFFTILVVISFLDDLFNKTN